MIVNMTKLPKGESFILASNLPEGKYRARVGSPTGDEVFLIATKRYDPDTWSVIGFTLESPGEIRFWRDGIEQQKKSRFYDVVKVEVERLDLIEVQGE
jgi:hypothetical protein